MQWIHSKNNDNLPVEPVDESVYENLDNRRGWGHMIPHINLEKKTKSCHIISQDET